MNQIKKIVFQLACVSMIAAAAPACMDAGDAGEETEGSTEQHATAVLLGGLYYYKTDDFDEQCGASKLYIRTGADNTLSNFTQITRGDVTYVKAHNNWNGAFSWHCGTWTSTDHDWSECDGPSQDWVRVWWDPNSRRINMKCYEKCSDGSSPSDCAPY